MGTNRCFRIVRSAILCPMLCAMVTAVGLAQQETAVQVVNRTAQAYGNQWTGGKIADWVGTGKVVISGDNNGQSDFTLIVKNNEKIKRVVQPSSGSRVSYGFDGQKSWHVIGPFSGDARGTAAYFIESETIRSVAKLFDTNNVLKDLGPADKKTVPESSDARVIESKNEKGQTTRYYIDDKTSLITRLEFDTGATYRMLFGEKQYPLYATFVFSDYRNVNGMMFPFKIAVYQGLIKYEEMTFTGIQYNTGVTDEVFVP